MGNFQEGLIAIVVIYNMELAHSKTFQSLNKALKKKNQILDLMVYDNSPNKQFHSEEFQLESFQVFYVSDINNPGVSKAYNTGFKRAESMGKKWMLLLDQDTDFPENVFDARGILHPWIFFSNGLNLFKELGAPGPCLRRMPCSWPSDI